MEDLTVILDLGNAYIKGVVLAKEDGRTVVIAKDKIKSDGMRKGKILDVNNFVYSIQNLLARFEKKIGTDFFDNLYIGLSHPDMEVKRVSEQKRIIDDKITQKEVNHLSSLVDETSGEKNYETIKIIPVQWIIDKDIKLKDPVGMEGNRLELMADVFMIPRNFYNSLSEVFEKLEIGVIDIIPNILGSVEVGLDVDAKDLGTLLVDIGANQTSYVVYEEGYPLRYDSIPIGAEDVTKDISIGMQIDIQEAEKLKRQEGSILLQDQTTDDDTIDKAFLSEVILARYEEIFEKINEGLADIDKQAKLPGGVILTGGGAKVDQLEHLAKEVFQLASFDCKDEKMNLGDISNDLQYLNLLGDYMWIEKYEGDMDSSFSLDLDLSGMLDSIIEFFRKLF